jgi:deoxyhypusine synthase
LKSAYDQGVPVFVPAFTDSELGLDVALHNRMREGSGRHKIRFDPFEDLEHFASTLLRQKRLGIFTIGGGVPRNWSQQFGPFIELRHRRLGENLPLKRYHYGLGQVCTSRGGWPVWRSIRGCDCGTATDCGGGAGAARERQAPRQEERESLSTTLALRLFLDIWGEGYLRPIPFST